MSAVASPLVATTLAFVRTDAGVVTVLEGGPVPKGADQGHVERLAAAGVFVASKAKPDSDKS